MKVIDVYENVYGGQRCLLVIMEWSVYDLGLLSWNRIILNKAVCFYNSTERFQSIIKIECLHAWSGILWNVKVV